MSVWLERIEEAKARTLEPAELTDLRRKILRPHRIGGTTMGVESSALMALIGSYERTHAEPGVTDYTKAVKGLLGRAVEMTRKARNMAEENGHQFHEGYLEATLTLLRNAQRSVI